jgi:hypothetical protein
VPAAYTEDIIVHEPWPESLNLQGVSDFDPNDPLYWAMEHCQSDPRVKQLRWVNDNSVNLEFYNKEDATLALTILTHPDNGDFSNVSMQEPRKAKPYSKKPDSVLMVRQSNAGDQKPRGAATRSNYYQRNPDVAGNRQREPRRKPPPKKDYLDYGDEEMASGERPRRRNSGDESMGDSGLDQRGPRRNGRDFRDDRDGRDNRGRGRGGRQPASGRLRNDAQGQDVDSYRPGSRRYVSTFPSMAVPPRPLTKKATADSGLPSTKRMQAVGGTAAEVVAVTTAVVANPAWIVGRTTVPTTIVRMALQLADVGRRTLSLLTLHQWATTIGQTL